MMIRRVLSLLIGFPIGIILVAIAVSNRQPVDLILDPFRPDAPAVSIQLPFYLYLMAALVIGVILGGVATWMGQSRWRQTARSQGRRAARWQAEADRLAREREAVTAAPGRSLAISGH